MSFFLCPIQNFLERSLIKMIHYVTCYFQEGNDIKFKAISKLDVPSFVIEHQNSPYIVVCDPRERINTIYEYGEIKNIAS